MKWEFVYYSSRVKKDISDLPKELFSEFIAIRNVIIEKGPNLGMPYTRAMGDGLFEIRLSDKDGIARVFYCTIEKHEVLILHSFIKKTRTTPDRELQLARKRLKEVKQHG
jgi:phage-related protein